MLTLNEALKIAGLPQRLNEAGDAVTVTIPDDKAEEFKQIAAKNDIRVKAQTHGPLGKYKEIEGKQHYSVVGDIQKFVKALPDDLAKLVTRGMSDLKNADNRVD